MDKLKYDIKNDDQELEALGKESEQFMDAIEAMMTGDWNRVAGALQIAKERLPDLLNYARLRQHGVIAPKRGGF